VVLLLALSLAMWAPRFRGPIDLRWDGAVYYVLGTSLAQGNGYRLLNEPGEIHAIQYPPLLPMVVCGYQWVLGTDDPAIVGWWLRVGYFLVTTLLSLAVYALARPILPAFYSLVAALLVTLHFFTFWMSDQLVADIPFALLTVLFLLFARRKTR